MAKEVGAIRTWVEDDGRERVCLEFWLDGVRRRIYSDVDRWGRRIPLTAESAKDLLDDIHAEIRKRQSIEAALAPFLGKSAPENSFGRRWEKYLDQKKREAATGEISRGHLRELQGMQKRGYLEPLLQRSIFDMSFGVLQDWLGWLGEAKPHLSARTRRHALMSVTSCLNWLAEREELEKAPKAPKVSIDEHAPILLSEETRSAILAAIPAPARGIFLCLAYMGLRPSEARALRTSAVQDGFLVVDRAAADNRASGETKGTKTRKARRLPIPPDLAAWIDEHVDSSRRLQQGPLFPNPLGKTSTKRWSPSAMDRTWNRACMKALGHRVAPLYEGTKHSFATNALNAGAELYHVQRFLGHTDARTTERYAKLADGALVSVLRTRNQLRTGSAPVAERSVPNDGDKAQ